MNRTTPGPLHLLVMPGDGIGPEITAATLEVLEAAKGAFGVSFTLEHVPIGLEALKQHGALVAPRTVDKARAAAGIILGPVSHQEKPGAVGGLTASGTLRKELDLFANIRPARSRPGLPPRCGKPVDLVVVRENTEGFYADRSMHFGHGEMMPTPDLAISIRKITRQGSTRIAETAFRLARQRRRKVTVVHKVNVLRLTEGLFLESVRAVARQFPDVTVEERIVDAMAALLVRDASQFDVIVTTNMYGDILSDEASEIAGSLGLAASINAGTDHAIAQAQHGSAPDIAGQDKANPASLIGSVAMLFAWLAERRGENRLADVAAAIEAAIDEVLLSEDGRTADLGGHLGTRAFGARVAQAVGKVRLANA